MRGMARPQRFAALLTVAEIAERLSPEELTGLPYVLEQTREDAVAALGCAGPGRPSWRAAVTAGNPAAVSASNSGRA